MLVLFLGKKFNSPSTNIYRKVVAELYTSQDRDAYVFTGSNLLLKFTPPPPKNKNKKKKKNTKTSEYETHHPLEATVDDW